jgi:Undecaprenyl-phosphate galactose phosphotransferase WbaP
MHELAVVPSHDYDSTISTELRSARDDFKQSEWVALVLIAVDILAVELALGLGFLIRHALTRWWPVNIQPEHVAGMAVGLLILPIGYYFVGLHPGYGMGPVERLRKRVLIATLVFATLITWDYLVYRGIWPRGVLLSTLAFVFVLQPAFESLARRMLMKFGVWGRPVVILGASTAGVAAHRMLTENPDLGLVPVGFFDDRMQQAEGRVQPVEIRGRTRDATLLCPNVRSAIIAMPNAKATRLNEIMYRLPFSDIVIIPNLMGFQTLWISVQDLNGILGLSVKRNLLLKHNRVIKRITDIIVGSILLVLALPVIGLFALLIKMIDPGPAFWVQERVGENGRPFRMIKLRSMCLDAEKRLEEYLAHNPTAKAEWERYMKLRNDPRILPTIGKFIRRFSIDELPQIWHVVRGDMSLVGPRPFLKYHIDRFGTEFQRLRASVRPGLTGLWQVSARSDGDLAVQEAQDTYFIRNWSLWLDLYVLMQTVVAVLRAKGAR